MAHKIMVHLANTKRTSGNKFNAEILCRWGIWFNSHLLEIEFIRITFANELDRVICQRTWLKAKAYSRASSAKITMDEIENVFDFSRNTLPSELPEYWNIWNCRKCEKFRKLSRMTKKNSEIVEDKYEIVENCHNSSATLATYPLRLKQRAFNHEHGDRCLLYKLIELLFRRL